ncbi:hypothetical protein GCT13_38410 [Paraburkholderia sp. CNPSo 3157]|uniref:Biotin carboxylation domain-containing protein n=1 Tax=Paraburkholderia franconis TaxID=2654983 RepID=A0A7X1NJ69_9BURK|nr:ABC transporter substrate-binding protein [Paraburkholderia franconis]MPW22538.1 hypothetical protein [Paraburkholderia franconis]
MNSRPFFPLFTTVVVASATYPLAAHAQAYPRPVIRVSSGAEDIATLEPDRATSTNDVTVVAEIFNGLVRFAPGSADPKSLEPDLAESWQASNDSKVWTFHLRHGVNFQGGWGELTATDVVYSLKRAADPKRSSFAADFAASGHAIEVRVYAEDPRRFVPSPGPLTVFRPPVANGVRVETGYAEGNRVTPFYDPMLAKVIARAPTRDAAIARITDALDAFDIEGVKTNIPFALDVLKSDAFQAGDVHTRLGTELAAHTSSRPAAEPAA